MSVVIVAAKRTPMGKFEGVYSSVSAVKLGSSVISSLAKNLNRNKDLIDAVIVGQSLTTGCGQNPARQSVINADLSSKIPAYCVNSVCGSGIQSVILGYQHILANKGDIVIASCQENMTCAAHYIKVRDKNFSYGDIKLKDTVVHDGLLDVYSKSSTGELAEKLSHIYRIDRSFQDNYTLESRDRFRRYLQSLHYFEYVESVDLKDNVIFKDETKKSDYSLARLSNMKPIFHTSGTITAGNSAHFADGAAGFLMMHTDKANELNLQPLVRIKSVSCVANDSNVINLAGVRAAKKSLSIAEWKIEDVDVLDVTEPFAVQVIAVMQDLKVDMKKVNLYGGALSMGYALGVSGAVSLINVIQAINNKSLNKGMAVVCAAGGLGLSICVEK
ncbi:thiolase family protein [Anaplasmataceae bacterium AB001_6]|nr:thiolase family protein [Anaplasmataceae bacterium AB001_6]